MNKLEEAMGNLNNIQDDIDAVIYAIGDSPRTIYRGRVAKYVDGHESTSPNLVRQVMG
jgi:hypothetical protein